MRHKMKLDNTASEGQELIRIVKRSPDFSQQKEGWNKTTNIYKPHPTKKYSSDRCKAKRQNSNAYTAGAATSKEPGHDRNQTRKHHDIDACLLSTPTAR